MCCIQHGGCWADGHTPVLDWAEDHMGHQHLWKPVKAHFKQLWVSNLSNPFCCDHLQCLLWVLLCQRSTSRDLYTFEVSVVVLFCDWKGPVGLETPACSLLSWSSSRLREFLGNFYWLLPAWVCMPPATSVHAAEMSTSRGSIRPILKHHPHKGRTFFHYFSWWKRCQTLSPELVSVNALVGFCMSERVELGVRNSSFHTGWR